jgi:hypothetical protein
MNWFTYTYLSTKQIFEKINYISIDNLAWIIFIIFWAFIIFALNNYIFPALLFWVENYKKEQKKKERWLLLKKIKLQREVEDEIEKSL